MTPAVLTAAGAALVAVIGAIGKAIVDIIKAKNQTDAEFKKAIIRAEIVNYYYDNKEQGTINAYEYQVIMNLYDIYKSLGGNSFIKEIIDEVKTWQIKA